MKEMMRRILLYLAFVAVVVMGAYYLLPKHQRQVAVALLSDIVAFLNPATVRENIQEKVEELTSTPVERRAKLLGELKENISSLRAVTWEAGASGAKSSEATKIEGVITRSEELVEKLERANTEEGLANKVTTGLFDQAVGLIAPIRESSSTAANQNCR